MSIPKADYSTVTLRPAVIDDCTADGQFLLAHGRTARSTVLIKASTKPDADTDLQVLTTAIVPQCATTATTLFHLCDSTCHAGRIAFSSGHECAAAGIHEQTLNKDSSAVIKNYKNGFMEF